VGNHNVLGNMGNSEYTEIWVREGDEWSLKSMWRDLDVARSIAFAKAGPVCILRAIYGKEVQRAIVQEIGISAIRLVPYLRSIFGANSVAAA
jgi:hypothetical protein